MGDVSLQADRQRGVAIRADTGDSEMSVVVGEGEELSTAKDRSSFSDETPGPTH